MACPFCGSEFLVHDYREGTVVCTGCGTVVDIIYAAPPPRGAEDPGSSPGRRDPGLRAPGRIFRTYSSLLGGRRLRRGVMLSPDLDLSSPPEKRPPKILVHERDKLVMGVVEKSPSLGKVLEILNDYPRILSRTSRARVAAAYIAVRKALGLPLPIGVLSRAVGLSRVHLKRLRHMVETAPGLVERVSRIADLVYEIRLIDLEIERLSRK